MEAGNITGHHLNVFIVSKQEAIFKVDYDSCFLSSGYKFSQSGVYFCPESDTCKTLEDYRNFINKLPIIDEPEIFGMHDNANIAFEVETKHETCPLFFAIILDNYNFYPTDE